MSGAVISFEDFGMEPDVPIYLQILRYIKRGIAAGTIRDGDELPSRRVLSALLGVNPNTVQKAYRVLEEQALIESHTGARSYMVLGAETVRRIRAELLESDVLALIQAMRQMGVEKQDALALVETLWERGGAV